MRNIFYVALFLVLFSSIAFADNSAENLKIQPMHVRVSSFVDEGGQPMFDGKVLHDGDVKTGWKENADGDGKGQWVQLFFPANVVLDSICISNGEGAGSNFKKFNRVKDASLIYSDRSQQNIVLADNGSMQKFQPSKKITNSLSFVIDSVYSGTDNQTAAISEFYVTYHRPGADEKAAILAAEQKKKLKPAVPAKKNEVIASTPKIRKSLKKHAKSDKLLTKEEAQKVFAEFFYKFYSNLVTLNDEYPRMYAEKEYMRESVVFDSFKYMIKNRGVLKYYQDAVVDTRDLKIEISSLRKREADIKVTGFYDVVFDLKVSTIPEDTKYYLVKEYGEWKVAEKVENPFR